MLQLNMLRTSFLVFALILSACKSTATKESVSSSIKRENIVTKKAKDIAKYNAASSSELNENEAFKNLALYFSSHVESLETAYGQVYYFTADGGDDGLTYHSLPDFYPTAMDSIAKTCKGKTVKSAYFGDIENESSFNLSPYFESPEQQQLLKAYSKGRFNYANIGKKRAIFQLINEISLNDSKVFYPEQVSQINEVTAAPQQGAPINCIENGKYKFFSDMLLGSPQTDHSTYSHKLIGILIPSETANNMIKEIAQHSWLIAQPGIARMKKSELRQEIRKTTYKASIIEEKARWDNRHSTELFLGDKVCSWDNKYGYIEEIGQKNVKVLWKGEVKASSGSGYSKLDYSPGFFFGQSTLKNFDRTFKTKIIDSIVWVPKGQIAGCNFR